MKRSTYSLLLFVFLAMTACAPVPPFELKPETPNLNIVSSRIRPLKIAVVVQDPMPYTLFYRGQGGYRRDMTADSRALGLMLERDLSRIVSETLSQAFSQVIVLRDLPQPGQYDAVVTINMKQILLQEKVILTGETCDTSAEWDMTVLDSRNREIFTDKGISPAHNFKFSIMTPSRDFVIGINSTMSLILNELAMEWGATLYNLKIPAAGRGNP